MSHYPDHLERMEDERAAARAKVTASLGAIVNLPAGFLSADAARMGVRRLKLRRALLDAQALIPTLLDHLDQGGDAFGDRAPIDIESRIKLRDSNRAGGVGHDPIDRVEGDDVGEEQLLQGADLFLQFLNSLLKALGHGRFSFRPFR